MGCNDRHTRGYAQANGNVPERIRRRLLRLERCDDT
jgi:hypothetical protein